MKNTDSSLSEHQRRTTSEAVFSESEAAGLLGISKAGLCRFRARGEIGYYRIGARVVYGQRHIDAFFAAAERLPRGS